MTNTTTNTIFVPILGNIEVNDDNVSLNDFAEFADVIINGEDNIVRIRVYNGGFNVSHIRKDCNDFFSNHGDFKFEDYPEIDKLVECALNEYL